MADLNSLSRAFYWHPEHSPSLDRVEAFARQVVAAVFSELEKKFDPFDALEGPYKRLTMDAKEYLALKRELCGEKEGGNVC